MSKITEIKEMIEVLAKEKKYEELNTIHDMVKYRDDWCKPFGEVNEKKELRSLNDIFYFLCGLMRGLQLKKSWNGQ